MPVQKPLGVTPREDRKNSNLYLHTLEAFAYQTDLSILDIPIPKPVRHLSQAVSGGMKTRDEVACASSTHPLKIFDLKKSRNEFVYACAPMVRYSRLAFRQTCHRFGVDICWTPMILAKDFNRNSFARDSDLTVHTPNPLLPSSQDSGPSNNGTGTQDNTTAKKHQRPACTVIQFGANSPLELSRASSLAAPWVNGVDLNCGCPQSWACGQTLGAALMSQRELVRDMVMATRTQLRSDGWDVDLEQSRDSASGRSVSVKIRVHDDLRRTVDWIDTVIGDPNHRNVDWITIHPRTRNQASSIPIRTEALELLTSKYSKILPVMLSGDVFDVSALPFGPFSGDSSSIPTFTTSDNDNTGITRGEPDRPAPTPSNTGLSGFMSARGLLANPALFAGYTSCPWEALEVFMGEIVRAPIPYQNTLHHVEEMLGPGMGSDKNSLLSKKERMELHDLDNMLELIDYLDEKYTEKMGRSGGLRRMV